MLNWFFAVVIWLVAVIHFIGTIGMMAQAYVAYDRTGKRVPRLSMWLIFRAFFTAALAVLGIWVAPL